MPIKPEPIVELLFNKQRLMEHIATSQESQDVVIIAGFLSAEDFPPFPIDIDHIAKQGIPIRLISKCLSNVAKSIWPITIIRIQNVNNHPTGALDALIHGMIMP